MSTNRTFSPQQSAVFSAVEVPRGRNLIVESVAGSGKTTVLVESCTRMTGSVALCAYNKKIADEIKMKVAHLTNVRAGTFHSFGFSAWRRVAPTVKVDGRKMENLIATEFTNIPEWATAFCLELASLAKQAAFGITSSFEACDWWSLINHYDVLDALPEDVQNDGVVEDAITWTIELLTRSNALCREVVDFNDQLYAPLKFNARMWQNDWVLIDEAQDTNVVRRMLAKKMLKPGGRIIAVGDPRQAIYGFTGANADSLDLIAEEFNCLRMPLTVTYRCPKAVVTHARQWVSHIEAHASAPDGSVRTISKLEFDTLRPVAGDVILCRNTAPLVETAFGLIRRGIGATIEGRDIGNGLVALAFRWKSVRTMGALRDRLNDYQARETQKLLANGKELKAAQVEDKVMALQAIIDSVAPDATMTDLRDAISRMFGDTQNQQGAPRTVLLSTVHKSKGREWDRVYLLGRNVLMPSRYARQAWQQEQETNLIYVAVTRAKCELIEVLFEEKKR